VFQSIVSAGVAAVVVVVEADFVDVEVEVEVVLEGAEVLKRRRVGEAILVAFMHVGRETVLAMERPVRSDMRIEAVAMVGNMSLVL
jgi:hypothetical protein